VKLPAPLRRFVRRRSSGGEVSAPAPPKVVLVSLGYMPGDERTRREATALSAAGLRVVTLAPARPGEALEEHTEGFAIRRLPRPAAWSDRVHERSLSLRERLPRAGRPLVRGAAGALALAIRAVEQRRDPALFYWRLTRALIDESAVGACVHAHHSLAAMAVARLVALGAGARFVGDYRDALVLLAPEEARASYYEQEEHWGDPPSKREVRRLEQTERLLPPDAKSILDIGCGDGRLTNRLAQTGRRVVGLDLSRSALRHVQGRRVAGSVVRLPFADDSFDLVLTTEMVEHLPDEALAVAATELQRVARRWIVLGVPWREQLALSVARCPRCRTTFHVNEHQRSFDLARLRDLLRPHFELVDHSWVGVRRHVYHPVLLGAKRHFGGLWARTPRTVCPRCGVRLAPAPHPEHNAVGARCDAWNERLHRARPEELSHVVALYARRGAAPRRPSRDGASARALQHAPVAAPREG